MRKAQIKLLLFEAAVALILLLNSFVSNILTNYLMILFVLTLIVIFNVTFIYERIRGMYVFDTIYHILVMILTFFIFYSVLGIVIGFAKTSNYYSWYGLKTFIIPITALIVFKEILRAQILNKIEDEKFLLITTCIMFVLFDISTGLFYNDFANAKDTFTFIALTLLPSVSSNVLCTYISKKSGAGPSIFYLLVMTLYRYLIPYLPNPNEYLASVINFLLPLVIYRRLLTVFQNEDEIENVRGNKVLNIIGLIIPSVCITVMVYLTSGYFKYQAVAVASGSMEPVISRGDVVIVDSTVSYDLINVGDVIAYKYNGIIIIHRVVNIVKDRGNYFFYTKGDANNNPDNYQIPDKTVIGVVHQKIPMIGLPTVWLSEF